MKIGILTQPLHTNYGGLLQAYALQTVLERMGHEAQVVRREWFWNHPDSRWVKTLIWLKAMVCRVLHRPVYVPVSSEEENAISRFTSVFISDNIKVTSRIYTNRSLKKEVRNQCFDAYVVGSDQVWRPRYSPCITNFFLDFLAREKHIRRVAYAASFGVDGWEYTPEQTECCAALAGRFDAVSVREDSGITLCRKYLHTEAVHVLDPTMLLEKEDYERLVGNVGEPLSDGKLFCYILDADDEKTALMRRISQFTGLLSFSVMAKLPATLKNRRQHLEDCVFPPVTRWLRGFMDAEMVVTDSFHGCVFSIIFNKPFWVVGNAGRGMARFSSLLSMYGLEDRLVTPSSFREIDVNRPIDWSRVNACRKEWQQKSLGFLSEALNQKHI